MNDLTISGNSIKAKILFFRGLHILLDRDLAVLYNIETRALKQAVNRNQKRFPQDFMFVLTKSEINLLVSQNVIPSKKYLGGALPYAFTEQGVANLASILTSDKAIEVNIQIMRAFISMRRFISKNAELFNRLDYVEKKQFEFEIKINSNFEKVFAAIEDKSFQKKQGIFYNGQIFDAYVFVSDLVRSAEKSIVLIDNYVDDSVLTLFSKRKKNVDVIIYTKDITKQLSLDLAKYNSQYPLVEIKEFKQSHDRFIIIDNKAVYHFGASLKDLGKKWFAFSKFEKEALNILNKLEIK